MSEHSGRPLGQASGGESGFWDRLGVSDDDLMPKHLPMGVDHLGRGPENDSEAYMYVCWCGDTECPLTLALGHAWAAGKRFEHLTDMLYDVARKVTDEVLGDGSYAEINKTNPHPAVQAAIRRLPDVVESPPDEASDSD